MPYEVKHTSMSHSDNNTCFSLRVDALAMPKHALVVLLRNMRVHSLNSELIAKSRRIDLLGKQEDVGKTYVHCC